VLLWAPMAEGGRGGGVTGLGNIGADKRSSMDNANSGASAVRSTFDKERTDVGLPGPASSRC